jgi:hypothetical protein
MKEKSFFPDLFEMAAKKSEIFCCHFKQIREKGFLLHPSCVSREASFSQNI